MERNERAGPKRQTLRRGVVREFLGIVPSGRLARKMKPEHALGRQMLCEIGRGSVELPKIEFGKSAHEMHP
jgi:hypothetical protein